MYCRSFLHNVTAGMLVYQNNPMGILFQEICIASEHVIESDLYLICLQAGRFGS